MVTWPSQHSFAKLILGNTIEQCHQIAYSIYVEHAINIEHILQIEWFHKILFPQYFYVIFHLQAFLSSSKINIDNMEIMDYFQFPYQPTHNSIKSTVSLSILSLDCRYCLDTNLLNTRLISIVTIPIVFVYLFVFVLRLGLVDLVWQVWIGRSGLIGQVWKVWFCRLGFVVWVQRVRFCMFGCV